MDLEERFAIPQAPWNIRNLLISAAPDLPGLRLNQSTFDLAYGMETNLRGSGLRLVESSAWRGQPPKLDYAYLEDFNESIGKEKSQQVQSYENLRIEKLKNWGESYKSWSKRLALFEVRDENEKTGHLNRSENVDFRLRPGVTRLPISPEKMEEFRAIESEITEVLETDFTPKADSPLTGGVLWGVEEPTILALSLIHI